MNDTYITFRGWLGGDVECREVSGDRRVARLRVASTPRRRRRNAETENGQDKWEDGPTTWHTVTAWNALADHVAASLSSGQPVLVHGRFEADVWTRDDGSVQARTVVVAESIGHDLTHGTAVFSRPDELASSPQEPAA